MQASKKGESDISRTSPNVRLSTKRKRPAVLANLSHIYTKQIYKPGSVFDNHLSRTYVATCLKPRFTKKN